MRSSLSLTLALAFLVAAAAPSRAQTPDLRWNDWMGCWELVGDGNVARLPPAEDAADRVTGPIRPGSDRSARVCVAPSQGGAELRTFVGGEPVLSQTIIADGIDHPVADGGCKGTQQARWSADGRRLFTRAQVACENQPSRTVTGIALMAPNGEWVDVQAVTIGAGGVWFQLGVVDLDAFRRTTEAGVPMVMDTCPAIEWPRLAQGA